ncbi:MAG: exonuclease domain-containing protein [Gemmatimonadota bacterium]
MNLIAFDIESTGLDPAEDRIVELAIVRPGEPEPLLCERFNPGVPIPAAASAVHGIRDADVAGCPPFAARAAEIQALLEGAILIGFGSRRFDTLMLDAELRRAGQPGIDLDAVKEIDLLMVWIRSEPRDLGAAARRFLGKSHVEAHGALPDALVLGPLLKAMMREWGHNLGAMVELSRPEGEVDRSRKFRLERGTGEVVFNFGQHRGELVREHEDYLDWMLKADFPDDTCRAIRRLRENGYRWPAASPRSASGRAGAPAGDLAE